MTQLRNKAIKGFKVGDAFTVSRTFSEKDMAAFAEVTRDYNPVHFDERFAGAKNFNARICHGLLVASILTEIGGQVGWLASKMNFRFKKPVFFGDRISCRLTINDINAKGKAKADAVFKNQDGDTVIEAKLEGILPGMQEKQVLKAMLAEGDPTNKIGDEGEGPYER